MQTRKLLPEPCLQQATQAFVIKRENQSRCLKLLNPSSKLWTPTRTVATSQRVAVLAYDIFMIIHRTELYKTAVVIQSEKCGGCELLGDAVAEKAPSRQSRSGWA
eukprot:6198119-Pleurochrysis_carterae.AAC.1